MINRHFVKHLLSVILILAILLVSFPVTSRVYAEENPGGQEEASPGENLGTSQEGPGNQDTQEAQEDIQEEIIRPAEPEEPKQQPEQQTPPVAQEPPSVEIEDVEIPGSEGPIQSEPEQPPIIYYTINWIDGDGSTQTEQVIEGETYYVKTPISISGYDFIGWESGYGSYSPGESVVAYSNATYRARYEAIYHTITWKCNGSTDSEEVQEGKSYIIRNPEHKVGYEFTGWVSSGRNTAYYPGQEETAYQSKVYTATYEKLKYDLTLNVQDLGNQPLETAKVELVNSRGVKQPIIGNGQGVYRASQIEDGDYSIKTTYLNEYGTVEKNSNLTINVSDNTDIEKTVRLRTPRLSDVPNPTSNSKLPINGTINPINMIDVTLPISMTFTIDSNRIFHAPENVQIISRCPAPLDTKILSINKSNNAPSLVAPNTYTEHGWNNLTKEKTYKELALTLNGQDLSKPGNSLGRLRSAFKNPQQLNLNLNAKYGKAWNNTKNYTFTYNIVFEFSMP